MFGVNVYDLDLWVQVDPIKKPIKRNSVGAGHVSQRWASAFDDHLDHRFIVLKKKKTWRQNDKMLRFEKHN